MNCSRWSSDSRERCRDFRKRQVSSAGKCDDCRTEQKVAVKGAGKVSAKIGKMVLG